MEGILLVVAGAAVMVGGAAADAVSEWRTPWFKSVAFSTNRTPVDWGSVGLLAGSPPAIWGVYLLQTLFALE